MTIGIAVAVPDGIALAADTQTTWHQTITTAKEKNTGNEFELQQPIRLPVGWSRMAKKLFPLTFGEVAFAACTSGASSLNNRTMYAVFKSLEHSYTGEPTCNQVTQHLIDGLQNQLRQQHNTDDLASAPITMCHFIIAGFEKKDVSRPFLQSHIVFSGTVTTEEGENSSGHILSWSSLQEQEYQYGGCWIGRAEFITHIVNHNNPKLPPISGQYHLMTLADAVDYTRFLVEFTCDFQRFAIMVPDCGRPITSAILTPEGYQSQVVGEISQMSRA
jgi:hypothetical protein